jgi:O6-methylguanine-DNA--protein-cysteine methyltransferase
MEKIYYSSFDSLVLKKVFVASTNKGVCMVDFLTSKETFLKGLRKQFPGDIVRDDRKNQKVLTQLKKYLKGELKHFDCPLDMKGTSFEKKVWSALKRIPYGRTRSYRYCNPWPSQSSGGRSQWFNHCLHPPCHRVIESNGGRRLWPWSEDKETTAQAQGPWI